MRLSVKLSKDLFRTGISGKLHSGPTLDCLKNCVPQLLRFHPVQQSPEELYSYHRLPIFNLLQITLLASPSTSQWKNSPIGSTQRGFQLHLCKSMFRAYSILFFNSDEQPDISRVVSLKVVDILSSLM